MMCTSQVHDTLALIMMARTHLSQDMHTRCSFENGSGTKLGTSACQNLLLHAAAMPAVTLPSCIGFWLEHICRSHLHSFKGRLRKS